MLRMVEASLIIGVALAVLAFGGTDPSSFALVQGLLLGVAALLATRPENWILTVPARFFLVPGVLTTVVLVQLCPLPDHVRQRFVERGSSVSGARLACLSLQPYATRTSFLVVLTCFVAFYLTQVIGRDRNRQQRLIVSLVSLGAFEAFYGLAQYLSGWQRIFTYVKKYDLEEATGTYINRNHYAGFLEMILPLALALLFYQYAKLRRNRIQPIVGVRKLITRASLQRLLFWLSISVVLLAALIFSRSRMGIVAAFVSLLVTFGLAAIRRFRGKTGLLLCAAFIGLSICFAVWVGPGTIVARFENVGQEYTLHDQSRLSIWQGAGALIQQHPWLGTGLGTFPIAYTTVQRSFLGMFVNHAHNDYLEISSDLGLPAALVLFVSIFFVLMRAVKTFLFAERDFERFAALGCAGSIVAVLLHTLTDFNLYIPANALLFSIVLGLAMSTPHRSLPSRSRALDA
jgi:O-antigen ligase